MNTTETIRAIGELADLMTRFPDDRGELLNLTARMRIRLHHLEGQITAGRPDLKAQAREHAQPNLARTAEQVELEEFLR